MGSESLAVALCCHGATVALFVMCVACLSDVCHKSRGTDTLFWCMFLHVRIFMLPFHEGGSESVDFLTQTLHWISPSKPLPCHKTPIQSDTFLVRHRHTG